MPTKEELRQQYEACHSDVTYKYYVTHELTQEQFEAQHAACWNTYRQALLDNGFAVWKWQYRFVKDVPSTLQELAETAQRSGLLQEVVTFDNELTPSEVEEIQRKFGPRSRLIGISKVLLEI